MSRDNTDRIVPRHIPNPTDLDLVHQDPNKTGKENVGQQNEPKGTLNDQVRDITIDASKWATDKGGRSTAFGKGGPGDKRGTSGDSTVTVKQTPESKS